MRKDMNLKVENLKGDVKVSSSGSIVIPKKIRNKKRIVIGQRLNIELDNNKIIINLKE